MSTPSTVGQPAQGSWLGDKCWSVPRCPKGTSAVQVPIGEHIKM